MQHSNFVNAYYQYLHISLNGRIGYKTKKEVDPTSGRFSITLIGENKSDKTIAVKPANILEITSGEDDTDFEDVPLYSRFGERFPLFFLKQIEDQARGETQTFDRARMELLFWAYSTLHAGQVCVCIYVCVCVCTYRFH